MLRVSEIYASYQGEGPNTGKPTVFVRFAGCNLKCPGWPCDTPHAIQPKIFIKEQKFYTPQALADDIVKMYPHVDNICYTGGEVFIQPIQDLESLMGLLAQNHTAYVSQECFTNGTQEIPLNVWRRLDTVVLDWKLPGSGEDVPYGPGTNVMRNINKLVHDDALKFTIKDRNDYDVAKVLYNTIIPSTAFGGVVYCGPVWGEIDSSELAAWMLEDGLPWRLNTQVHKYVWPPDARRT